MTVAQLAQVLTRYGGKKDGHVLVVGADTDVSLLVELEGETLSIPRVTRVDAGGEPLVIAETARGEAFAFAVDGLLAVKVERVEGKRGDRGAGFVK